MKKLLCIEEICSNIYGMYDCIQLSNHIPRKEPGGGEPEIPNVPEGAVF